MSSQPKMASIKHWTVHEPYLNIHCGLGEAPYHEVPTSTVRFVDIKKKRLHTISTTEGHSSLHTIELDMPIGVTADIEGVDPKTKILVGGKSGIYILDRGSGRYELLKRFYESEEKDERLRSNDGAVDPTGGFWIGTMNDFWVGEPKAEGTLFHFSSNLTRTTHLTSLTIPNGIGWSRDQKTLYFTNTTEKDILAFDYHPSSNSISNQRVFYHHDGDGNPDGFKMDEEGCIWQAIYGEGRVLRICPEGKIIGQVDLPAKNVTCPAFVGTELWVTSADEEGEEFSGGLFRVDVGVHGLTDFKFKLEKEVAGS